jgi:hypothetical protein
MWVKQSELSAFIQSVQKIENLGVIKGGNHQSFVQRINEMTPGDCYDFIQAIENIKYFGRALGMKDVEILQEIGK